MVKTLRSMNNTIKQKRISAELSGDDKEAYDAMDGLSQKEDMVGELKRDPKYIRYLKKLIGFYKERGFENEDRVLEATRKRFIEEATKIVNL
jgi:hypothetical protein